MIRIELRTFAVQPRIILFCLGIKAHLLSNRTHSTYILQPRKSNKKMKDLKNLAKFLFLIGATLAQEKDSSTKLCDNEKGKVFFAKLDACTSLAEQDFYLNFLSNDISKAACDFLSAKVNITICYFWTMLNCERSILRVFLPIL